MWRTEINHGEIKEYQELARRTRGVTQCCEGYNTYSATLCQLDWKKITKDRLIWNCVYSTPHHWCNNVNLMYWCVFQRPTALHDLANSNTLVRDAIRVQVKHFFSPISWLVPGFQLRVRNHRHHLSPSPAVCWTGRRFKKNVSCTGEK